MSEDEKLGRDTSREVDSKWGFRETVDIFDTL